jgi:hypothetical protein
VATLAPSVGNPRRQQVYRPLPGMGSGTLAARLDSMLHEGRRRIARERFRWQRNREAYRGNTYLQPHALSRGTGQLHRLAPGDLLPSGRRRDSLNKMRQMIDGRVAMYTRQKPPHEVDAASRERAAVDGARVATRYVDFQWDNVKGWNIAGSNRTIALYAEQDGIAFRFVTYDRSAGDVVREVLAPNPETGELEPVEDRKRLEALMEQDPEGGRLWQARYYPVGEVKLRAVRAGTLAIDPNWTAADDWTACQWVIESRRRTIVELEREIGEPLDAVIDRSNEALSKRQTRRTGGTVENEDGSGERSIDPQREVFVHELYHVATGETGEFPMGAHVVWIQDAAGAPIIAEPWVWPDGRPRGLPCRPYIPRPDGGHPLGTMGTADELIPVQRQIDRRFSQYGEWLDLAARPPLVMVGGTLRSRSVYNADRVVYVNPGFERPFFLQVPPDPGIALLQMLQMLFQEMGELAIQSSAVRGQEIPGVEAAAAYNALALRSEGQLGGTESEFQENVQWTVSEALLNVHYFFTIKRKVEMPGMDDQAEFQAFKNTSIHGATSYRIKGSVLPKNKAAQQQMLLQFMQYAGPRFDPTPFAAEILEGDVETIVSMERAQGRKQESENLMLAALGALPEAQKVWDTFTAMRDAYIEAYTAIAQRMARAAHETGQAPTMNPQQVMRLIGPPPPRILDILARAGHKVPRVAVSDRDHMHVRSLELWMTNDGFPEEHPLVQQAALEHLNEHLDQQARRTAAIAMQSPQMADATPGAQPPQAPPDQEQ